MFTSNVTASVKKDFMAFPNSQLWWIISPQVFKLSTSYYRIAENFGGQKPWGIWKFATNLPKFYPPIAYNIWKPYGLGLASAGVGNLFCFYIKIRTRTWKNKSFKRGIRIAEKSKETRGDWWSGNINHKSLDLIKMLKGHWVK